MTANISQTAVQQQYPRISFKKCIIYNHEKTINELTFNSSKEILSNPTIKRCLDMHYRDERYKVFTFLAFVVVMKLGTKLAHMNRSLALSAPNNWKSVFFKYMVIPYLMSMYKYFKDIKRTLMEIESAVDEDPAADELWQPLFERCYPDPNQVLYSSPFTKFTMEDIKRSSSSQKTESKASNIVI